MERLRSIAKYWSWLPAFRAVGEACHLPSAAKSLHVSPSALSRSVQQLEETLGCTLFRREHRRLELTHEGESFLAAVRDSMRGVHEAMLVIQGKQIFGDLRVCSHGVATSAWVLPALLDLAVDHPDLQLQLESSGPIVVERLLSGKLDVLFGSSQIRHPRLRCEKLGEAHAGVYCGPSHDLHQRSEVQIDEILGCGFVAPPPAEDGRYLDGWPNELERRILFHVDQMRLGAEVCMTRPLLAVLPDLVAEDVGRGRLHRLPIELIPSAPVYGTTRPPIGTQTAAELVVQAVRMRISAPPTRRS